MTVIDYMTMFLSNFFVVFLLGLQSKNVQSNRYIAAIVTSIGISVGQFTFVKYAAQGSYDVFIVSALGGAIGIATSIWFYKRIVEKKRED